MTMIIDDWLHDCGDKCLYIGFGFQWIPIKKKHWGDSLHNWGGQRKHNCHK